MDKIVKDNFFGHAYYAPGYLYDWIRHLTGQGWIEDRLSQRWYEGDDYYTAHWNYDGLGSLSEEYRAEYAACPYQGEIPPNCPGYKYDTVEKGKWIEDNPDLDWYKHCESLEWNAWLHDPYA